MNLTESRLWHHKRESHFGKLVAEIKLRRVLSANLRISRTRSAQRNNPFLKCEALARNNSRRRHWDATKSLVDSLEKWKLKLDRFFDNWKKISRSFFSYGKVNNISQLTADTHVLKVCFEYGESFFLLTSTWDLQQYKLLPKASIFLARVTVYSVSQLSSHWGSLFLQMRNKYTHENNICAYVVV